MKKLRDTCLECGDPIPSGNRMDSKFCCPSCKARYWRKRKSGIQPQLQGSARETEPYSGNIPSDNTPLTGLRGVINSDGETNEKESGKGGNDEKQKDTRQKPYDAGQDCLTEYIPEETEEYKKALSEKNLWEGKVERIKDIIKRCGEEINRIEQLQSSKKKHTPPMHKGMDALMAYDATWWENTQGSESGFDKEKKETLAQLRANKASAEQMLSRGIAALKRAEETLANIPRHKPGPKRLSEKVDKLLGEKESETKERSEGNYVTEESEIKQNENSGQSPVNTNDMNENENQGKNAVGNADEILKNYPWIINSTDLGKVKRTRLNFQGKWLDFLGQPGTDFHLAIHGASGQGKSTMCFQLSKYLAVNFGKVIYFANEENTNSVTFEQKAKLAGAVHPDLHFVNIGTYEEIQKKVPPGIFHFIFIDSLNTLNVTPERLRELKTYFLKSAFISISRETKGGQLRGSNEILHDADIVVEVSELVATTTKNRYKEIDRKYVIIEKQKDDNNSEKSIGPTGLKNVI